ncbi:MAG: hypothetical protein ACPGJS_10825 [Flammeovirgaceae bacterium]
MLNDSDLINDQHHLDKYQAFCDLYEIQDIKTVVRLYDIYELVAFFPASPSDSDKKALQELIGTQTPAGYLDYTRSTNTFELVMKWQEKTGKFDDTAISFNDFSMNDKNKQ